MWLNDPLMTGTKSPVPNIRHTTLCHPKRTSFWRSSVTLLWGGHPSICQSLLHSADTGGGVRGVRRGGGYKQASHKRCCSNIPVQGTDFHTVVQPNIGIGGVYRVHRCWEALSLIQRFQVGAWTTVHTMRRRRRIRQQGFWRDQDASTDGRLRITFWQQQPHNKGKQIHFVLYNHFDLSAHSSLEHYAECATGLTGESTTELLAHCRAAVGTVCSQQAKIMNPN